MKKKFNFIITNLFTMIRAVGVIAMIPIFKIYGGAAAALTSALCFLTDFIDGKLARGLESSTFFGSFIDGATDKMFLIVSMLLLLGITPLAIIPIIFELGIVGVQSLKYKKNLNVKSNMIGKIKMWVAGITLTLSYLLIDKTFLDYASTNIINFLNNNKLTLSILGENTIHKLSDSIFSIISSIDSKVFTKLMIPLVASEALTLGSYIKEYKTETPSEVNEEKLAQRLQKYDIKDILFNHEVYEEFKDQENLKLIRTLTKKK